MRVWLCQSSQIWHLRHLLLFWKINISLVLWHVMNQPGKRILKKKCFVDYDNNNLRKTFSSQLLLLYILGTFLSHLEVGHICSIRRWATNIWLQSWWNQSTELIFRLKTKTRDKNRMILQRTSEMLDDNRRVDRAQRRQQRRCQRAPGLCWHFSGTKVHFCFKSSKFFPSFLFSDNFVVTLFINRHWSYIVGHFMKI